MYTHTHTHTCIHTVYAQTNTGQQCVTKQLTFDSWMETVVVSAGLDAAKGLELKTTNLKIPWITSAPSRIATVL